MIRLLRMLLVATPASLALASACALPNASWGVVVTNEQELRDALSNEDSVITFNVAGGVIELTSNLPLILHTVTIDGADLVTIDGGKTGTAGSGFRVFYVGSGADLTLQNITVANGAARGGAGAGNGGGGLGAGGAVFVDAGATAALTNVTFTDNGAFGGNAGSGGDGGGGGGLGGNGGTLGGGGGGFHIGSNGGNGFLSGGGGGGGGTSASGTGSAGGNGGPDAGGVLFGGDGAGVTGGAGGDPGNDGGSRATNAGQGGGGAGAPNRNGGAGGGSAGGGGASGTGRGGNGGTFGGGGGSPSGVGGNGGYGGGGGGTSSGGTPGSGGFGGGNGATSGGGFGGSGFGGAVFVRSGGTLTIDLSASMGAGNSTSGGTNGDTSSAPAGGDDLYLDGGAVEINVAGAATGRIEGSVGGSGGFEKTGTGFLVLEGSNTYSGTTTISDGTLVGDTGSLPGNIVIDTVGAELRIDQADAAGILTGNVSGSGSLTKLGAQTVTLMGNNSYSGGTFIEAGTLIGTTDTIPDHAIEFTGAGVLEFDQDFDGTQAGVISGSAGSMRKSGTGTLTLTAANDFSGASTVSAGALKLASGASLAGSVEVASGATLQLMSGASLAGSVDVAAGATFRGAGTVMTDLTADGTVEPGDSAGTVGETLKVNGNVDFGATSTLAIGASGASADNIDADGTINVDSGATLDLALDPDTDYSTGVTSLDVLSGTTLTGGTNFSIVPELFFLKTEIVTTPSTLSIEVSRDPTKTFVAIAQNDNQVATGTILDMAEAASSSPLDSVVNTLINESTATTASLALDAMAGPSLTAFDTTRLATAERFRNNIVRRFGYRGPGKEALARRDDAAPVFALHRPSAETFPGAQPRFLAGERPSKFTSSENELGIAGWLDGYGVIASVDADANAAGYNYSIVGTTLGIDWHPIDAALIGAAAGYAHTAIDFDANDAFTKGDSVQGALYGAYMKERYYAGGIFRYAHSDFRTGRNIAQGGLDAHASATAYGDQVGSYVEGGIVAAELYGFELQPMASFDYLHLWRSRIGESGAGVLNLGVEANEIDSMLFSAGARAHTEFEFERDYYMAPELWVRWSHEFGDAERRIDAALAGSPNSPFVVRGVEVPRDTAHVGAGWSIHGPNDLNLFVDYDLAINSTLTAHTIRAGALIPF